MADDKKKEDQGDEAKKKKGLSPVIMIALGAIVGGAGVVFAIPPKTETIVAPAPEFEDVHVMHPDLIQQTFNPKQRAGKGVMKMSFYFVYTLTQEKGKADIEHAAFELIVKNWKRASSDAGSVLRSRSYEELSSESGMKLLEHDLLEALTEAMFAHDLPEGQEPIARVSEIMVNELLKQ
ncbi:MAG: flagellar basal body-associated protein FliL [Planctomycetota bacterium]